MRRPTKAPTPRRAEASAVAGDAASLGSHLADNAASLGYRLADNAASLGYRLADNAASLGYRLAGVAANRRNRGSDNTLPTDSVCGLLVHSARGLPGGANGAADGHDNHHYGIPGHGRSRGSGKTYPAPKRPSRRRRPEERRKLLQELPRRSIWKNLNMTQILHVVGLILRRRRGDPHSRKRIEAELR